MLMARLEKPLYRDMASLLRQCFRFCHQCRCELPSPSDPSGQLESRLAELNTLIAITGSYFGQGEVYDSRQHIDIHSSGDSGNVAENLLDGDDDEEEEEEDDEEYMANEQNILYDTHVPIRSGAGLDTDAQSIEDGEIV